MFKKLAPMFMQAGKSKLHRVGQGRNRQGSALLS